VNGLASSSAVGTAISIAAFVVFLSWVLLLVLLIATYAVLVMGRKAGRRVQAGPRAGVAPGRGSGTPPPGLKALRRADPRFDEQLLLDAAQTATLLMFVANATGDEGPISRVVSESFWQTRTGRVLQTIARDRRAEADFAARRHEASRSRQQNVPVDYQASAPQITAVRLGRENEVCVRIAFGGLAAIVRPGAGAMAAGVAATSLTSGFAALGRAVAEQAADEKEQSVSWVGTDGHYDLTFVRPSGAQTDPATALADRTCTTCGATYQSELATTCQHCGAARPMPWGQWRLASAVPAS
jgi:hypothetical protein